MKSSILKTARNLRGIYFIDPEDTEIQGNHQERA